MSTPPPDLTAIAASNGILAPLARHVLALDARLAAVERDPLALRDRLASVERRLAAVEARGQPTFEPGGYAECSTCAAKPGVPTLCATCLRNGEIVGGLNAEIAALRAKLADETQRRVNAESHRDTAVAEVDRLKADLARLTKPGPASDFEALVDSYGDAMVALREANDHNGDPGDKALMAKDAARANLIGAIGAALVGDPMMRTPERRAIRERERAEAARGVDGHARAEQPAPAPDATDEEIAMAVDGYLRSHRGWGEGHGHRSDLTAAIATVVRPMLRAADERAAQFRADVIDKSAECAALTVRAEEAESRAQRAESEWKREVDKLIADRARLTDEVEARDGFRRDAEDRATRAERDAARFRHNADCGLRAKDEWIEELRAKLKKAEQERDEARRLRIETGRALDAAREAHAAESTAFTISGVTVGRDMKVTATHGPTRVTLPPPSRPTHADDPPFDSADHEKRAEHAFWIFDGERSRGGAERDAFKGAVRRLLSERDCHARVTAPPVQAPAIDAGALRALMFGADPLTMRAQADAIDGRNCDGGAMASTLRQYAAILERMTLASVGAPPAPTPTAEPVAWGAEDVSRHLDGGAVERDERWPCQPGCVVDSADANDATVLTEAMLAEAWRAVADTPAPDGDDNDAFDADTTRRLFAALTRNGPVAAPTVAGPVEIVDQPPPTRTDGPPVWDLVIADMKARDATGRERYGVPLQAFNGRRALVDAYQEILDLAVYVRQEIEERRATVVGEVSVEEIVAAWDAIASEAPTHRLPSDAVRRAVQRYVGKRIGEGE